MIRAVRRDAAATGDDEIAGDGRRGKSQEQASQFSLTHEGFLDRPSDLVD
jgi:hypothetical protein